MVLGDFAMEFGKAEIRFDELAHRVRKLEKGHAALLGAEREVLDELARVYLPELSLETVSGGLDVLRDRLEEALAEQSRRRKALGAEATAARERVDRADRELKEAEAELGRLMERMAAARERVAGALDDDEEHAARVAEHEAIMERRERLKRRRVRLQAAAGVERHRYESDVAFEYLRRRGFGEPGYRAGFLTRRLDGWLARRIDYDALSRRYRILTRGPHQIHAEIRGLEERAAELEGDLDRREEEVAREEGLLPLLRDEAALQERVAGRRRALEEETAKRRALRKELRAMELNRGRQHDEAIDLHRRHLGEKTIQELESLARSTPDPRDDALVERLDEVRGKLASLERDLAVQVRELERRARMEDRIEELQSMELDRFGRPRMYFPEDFQAHLVVEELMAGEKGADEVIRHLEEEVVEEPGVMEVERPYFEGLFRELTAEFERVVAESPVRRVEEEGRTEVIIRDAEGRVVGRRVTRRKLGS